MNKIILIGNLTRDPESNTTQGGVTFTRFTIAVNRPANAQGERFADYFDIIAWRNVAENCAKYLVKGNKVCVVGHVQRRQYEDRDGIKRTSFDVYADEVEFLTPKTTTQGNNNDRQGSRQPDTVNPSVDPQSGTMGLTLVDGDDLPF